MTLTGEDDQILVDCLNLPAHTNRDDMGEALARARRYADHGDRGVQAVLTAHSGPVRADARRPTVALPLLLIAQIEHYNAMLAHRVNEAERGRRLNWHLPQVDRVLDVRHASRLDQVDQALATVG